MFHHCIDFLHTFLFGLPRLLISLSFSLKCIIGSIENEFKNFFKKSVGGGGVVGVGVGGRS